MFRFRKQDESRSSSENSTWGIRRRFEQGKLHVNHTKFLGYDKDKNGNLVVNEKQAKIVRLIYKEFLDGKGANRIARDLELSGVPNWNGKAKWYEGSIRKMITNEKYKGDALLLQYGIQKLEYATTDNPFAGRVICGSCGQIFGRKVWNSTDDRFRRIIWRCNGKYVEKGERGCDSRHIDDKVLYQVFVEVFNMMVENKDCFLDKWKEMWESDSSLQRYKTKQFAKSIAERGRIKEFDVELYFALVEKVVVHGEGRLMVVMLDGTAVECATE